MRKFLLTFLSFFLFSSVCYGAITFDTKSSKGGSDNANPTNVSHTCSANAKLLVCSIIIQQNSGSLNSTPTYNGTVMTKAGSTISGTAEGSVEIFYLLAPDTGSSYTLSVSNPNNYQYDTYISSYDATNSVLFDQTASSNTTGTTATATINSVPANNVLVDAYVGGHRDIATANSDNLLYSADGGQWNSGAQYQLNASSGNYSMSFTQGASDDVAYLVASFYEEAGGGGGDRRIFRTIAG